MNLFTLMAQATTSASVLIITHALFLHHALFPDKGLLKGHVEL